MQTIKTSKGYITFKPYPLYFGVQQIDKKISLENLLIAKEVLDSHCIPFIFVAGTLLGAVREKDFIDHDEDIDLGILSEYRDQVIECLDDLLQRGFEIARYHRTKKLLSIIRKGQYIDFNFFSPYNNELRSSGGWLAFERCFQETTEIEFLGTSFMIPSDYEAYLESDYGPNWRTPVKWNDYTMPKWKTKLFELKENIKNILPRPLYNYFINKRARKEGATSINNMNGYTKRRGLPSVNFDPYN